MKIGYARASTNDQNLDLQRDALKAAGCDKIFEDTESGAKANRPGLLAAIEYARKGDPWLPGGWIAWAARCLLGSWRTGG